MKRFLDEDLNGAEFRECLMSDSRFIGVVMQNAEIDGLVTDLVVNGVEVTAYVEAELDRRHPVRLLIRSDDLADLREAHRQLMEGWASTVERMHATPGIEHRSVNDEWSAVQTMRHLVFVHDSWFRRCVLASSELFTPMGHRADRRPYLEQGLDRAAAPSLDEILVRPRRSRRPSSRRGSTPSPLSSCASRRPSPTTTSGRRTHGDDRCGSASARCSTRPSSTTASAYATST